MAGVAGVAAVAATAPAAPAHPGRPGVFEAHDHRTRGGQWHVELTLAHDGRRVKNVVVYSQRCDETLAIASAPVSEEGEVAATIGGLTLGGRLAGPSVLRGSFTVSKPGCTDTQAFTARRRAPGGHAHRGAYGDPREATRRDVKLWRATRRAARTRFPSYAAARRAGYTRFTGFPWKRPLVFHVRHDGYVNDGVALDPARPESLVYWWPRRGRPVLLGFMYRAPASGRVPPGILRWHRHREEGRLGTTKMTHVWLTGGIASAAATCLPVPALERALPAFAFRRMGVLGANESRPCPRRP